MGGEVSRISSAPTRYMVWHLVPLHRRQRDVDRPAFRVDDGMPSQLHVPLFGKHCLLEPSCVHVKPCGHSLADWQA